MIYKKRTSEVYIHSFVSLMQMGYTRAKQAGRTTLEALEESLRRNGRAVIFTSLILALGFWSGLVGSFKPTLYFSFLMGLTLMFDLLADLLVTPSMVLAVEGP